MLGSEEFLRDVNALVRVPLLRVRDLLSLRRWSHVTNAVQFGTILQQRVEMQFEFSRLERGSYIPPHTDDPKKLISLLLYFPDPNWQACYGGGTEFYRAKNPATEDNWDNRMVPFEDLVPFFKAPF